MGMSSSDHNPDAIQKYCHSGEKETGNHNSYIHKIYYFPKIDTLAVIDCDSKFFSIYNSNMEHLTTIKVTGGEARSVAYIDEHNQYAVSSTDLSLSFYDAHNFTFVKQFRTPGASQTMIFFNNICVHVPLI
tara:strand:- start:165 stop:557 length:393 start_codon:yes stop_codon:yes gene_type:complete